MAYQNILVAIDLTEEAEEVLTKAREVTNQQPQAKLSAVTVLRPLTHSFSGLDAAGMAAAAPIEAQMRTQARSQFDELTAKFDIPKDATHICEGQPAAEIRNLASQADVDLIVIGTHGRHGLGLLLGSTANGVLHGVTCDVLTVKIPTHS
ncbi:MAG: universal stress protein [Pseudomonadota bacterium]